MEDVNPTKHRPETVASEETLHRAAVMLGAVAVHIAGRETSYLAEMLRAHPEGQTEALAAIQSLHKYILTPDAAPVTAPVTPLHEQLGERLLSLKTYRGELAGKFNSYTIMDAGRFDLTGIEHKKYGFPLGDMLNDPGAAGPSNTFTIYPGLAAYFLKAVVGQGSPEKRRLVDLLEDGQIIQLVGYACAINKNKRQPNEAQSDLDRQAKRLLMNLGGVSDLKIAASEGSRSKDASHIRRSRRVMLGHLYGYTDLILNHMDGMIRDPQYRLFDHDPIKGLILAPEAMTALETIVQPTERLTPIKIIEYAMRRYTANELLDRLERGEASLHDIALNLQVIWLKVNGKSSEEITRTTGVSGERQDESFLALHVPMQHKLPLGRPFWRQVHTIMNEAKGILGTDKIAVSAEAVSALRISADTQGPAQSRQAGTGLTDTRAKTMSDAAFNTYIGNIVSDNKLLEYMRWAVSRPARWAQRMACREDPDSIETGKNDRPLSPDLQARCVSCTVREICLGNALAQPPGSGLHYNYAGYTASERTQLLQTAGIDTGTLQETFGNDRRGAS